MIYLSSGRLRDLKTNEHFKLSFLKVVSVTYKEWLLTRGSKYNDLTCKLLVFWKTGLRRGGRLREVVATGGSTMLNDYNLPERFFAIHCIRRTIGLQLVINSLLLYLKYLSCTKLDSYARAS